MAIVVHFSGSSTYGTHPTVNHTTVSKTVLSMKRRRGIERVEPVLLKIPRHRLLLSQSLWNFYNSARKTYISKLIQSIFFFFFFFHRISFLLKNGIELMQQIFVKCNVKCNITVRLQVSATQTCRIMIGNFN